MSDDREREHCNDVARELWDESMAHAMGKAGSAHDTWRAIIQRERAAAAAEARGQDAALLDAKAARHWKAAEEHEEFGDDETAILQESVAMCLEEAAKAIRALRGGGR